MWNFRKALEVLYEIVDNCIGITVYLSIDTIMHWVYNFNNSKNPVFSMRYVFYWNSDFFIRYDLLKWNFISEFILINYQFEGLTKILF